MNLEKMENLQYDVTCRPHTNTTINTHKHTRIKAYRDHAAQGWQGRGSQVQLNSEIAWTQSKTDAQIQREGRERSRL